MTKFVALLIVLTIVGCNPAIVRNVSSDVETKKVPIVEKTDESDARHKETLKAIGDLADAIKNQHSHDTITKDDLASLVESFGSKVHEELHEHLDNKQQNPLPIVSETEVNPLPAREEVIQESRQVPKRPRESDFEAKAPGVGEVAEASPSETFTGIKMHYRLKNCPWCKLAIRRFNGVDAEGNVIDLDAPANKGWTIGPSPQYHIWMVEDPDGTVPRFELFIKGEFVDTIAEGFGNDANIWDIVSKHPKHRSRKRPSRVSKSNQAGSLERSNNVIYASTYTDCSGFGAVSDCSGLAMALDCSGGFSASDCSGLSTSDCSGSDFTVMAGPPIVVGNPVGSYRYEFPVRRSTSPLSRVPPGTPRWGYAGFSLTQHLMGPPHYYSYSYLMSLTPRQRERLHSGEHEKHARVTGDRRPYYPYSGVPFYGSLKSDSVAYYAPARRRAPFQGVAVGGMPLLGQQGTNTIIGGVPINTGSALVGAGLTAALLAL